MKRTTFAIVALLFLAFLPYTALNAQTLYPTKIIKPAHFDISKPLRDVKPIAPGVRERSWKNNLIKNHLGIPDEFKDAREMTGPDPVLQSQMTGSRSEPQIGENFPGVSNVNGVAPPDTDGDVGPDHYFQMINLSFAIWDKEGNMLMPPADNQTIWEGFDDGKPFDNANDGDPIVLYDEQADRWMVSQFAVSNPNNKFYELIAISVTPDPTGAWYRYAFEFDKMPDYPKFGIWPDGYYFTVNQFTNGQYWAGAGVAIVDRDAMINGEDDATMVFFSLGSSYGSLLPADFDGETPPPEGAPNYCMNLGSNKLRIWEVVVDWDNVDNSTISLTQSLPTQAFNVNNIAVRQPGTGNQLGTLAGRLMYRLQYRNFGDREVMVTNHSVNAGGGRAGVRWYELRKTDADWSIYQQGTYAPDDGDSRWMASVAMNDNGDIAVGYSVSGTSTYPSIRVAGQTAGAPEGLGVLDIDEASILEGSKSQTGVSRWGDYAMMSVDPADGETFWFTTEYSNGGWSWKTQIASISFATVPNAEFISDETLIPVGETVNFTDETSGVPNSWQWSFTGANPDTSTQENPENIQYNTEGEFDVRLIVSNDLGTDTILKTAYITSSATILPEVDFIADKNYDCLGDVVTFTDQTQYSPIQWLWEFDPPTVNFVNGTDENSANPQVVFDAAGTYAVTLTAWNLNGPSTLSKPDFINPGGYTPYFRETFVDGFDAQGWTIENPDGEKTWELLEVGGTIPGTEAAGVNFTDYFAIGQRDRLISPPYNLENMSSAALEFSHAYAKKYDEVTDSLIIYVSADCGENWSRVFADGEDGSGNFATHEAGADFWPETASDWCGTGWGAPCISIDLSPWAGQSDLRFAFETYSAIGNPLFIDNISVSQYVGIDNELENAGGVLVYPNPANGNFTVVLPAEGEFTEVQLVNFLGQTVMRTQLKANKNSLEIQRQADWKPGAYFLKINGPTETLTKKVILY
ncbi:MAG: PKD domain-containing protein [Bacteroidales bacterium]|nr:PKD domain-containing protein [Bacteroidales bacterium]